MDNAVQLSCKQEVLNSYYKNNAAKLHKLVDRILSRFGGIENKDVDDFYSLANEVFTDVIKRYDASQSFDVFLYSCLSNRIMTEITRRNREKRMTDRMSVSIDSPLSDKDDTTLQDIIADSFDMEREIFGDESSMSAKISKYLNNLTNRQRKIVWLLADSYGAGEVCEILDISKREYTDAMKGIYAYRNISILF